MYLDIPLLVDFQCIALGCSTFILQIPITAWNFKVMKKIYLLILLATFSINLLCQQDSEIVRDSTYSYIWDTITNDWVIDWRRVNTYDANGNLTEVIDYGWDSETNNWVGDERNVWAYDANGNLTERITYKWDSGTNDWVVGFRTDYSSDANGNITEEIFYRWDSETDDWVASSRRVSKYNANGNQTEYIMYNWDSKTNDWFYDFKLVSYWSELTTSISNNIIDPNYIVYPNPFKDYTTIKLSNDVQTQKIELIDIHGRIVRTIDNVNSNSVSIHRENLPSGIYFVRIHSADTRYVILFL